MRRRENGDTLLEHNKCYHINYGIFLLRIFKFSTRFTVYFVSDSVCISTSLLSLLSFALVASHLTSKMNVMNMEQQLLLFITLSPQT